jgi:hypothetical protein
LLQSSAIRAIGVPPQTLKIARILATTTGMSRTEVGTIPQNCEKKQLLAVPRSRVRSAVDAALAALS